MNPNRLALLGLLAALTGTALLPAAPATARTAPACRADALTEAPIKGGAQLGDYKGVPLPASFKPAANETHVDALLMAIYIKRADWPCFEAKFPQAAAIFTAHMQR